MDQQQNGQRQKGPRKVVAAEKRCASLFSQLNWQNSKLEFLKSALKKDKTTKILLCITLKFDIFSSLLLEHSCEILLWINRTQTMTTGLSKKDAQTKSFQTVLVTFHCSV